MSPNTLTFQSYNLNSEITFLSKSYLVVTTINLTFIHHPLGRALHNCSSSFTSCFQNILEPAFLAFLTFFMGYLTCPVSFPFL